MASTEDHLPSLSDVDLPAAGGRKRMSRRTKTVLNIVAGAVLLVVVAVVIGGCWLFRESENMAITKATYEAVVVGQPEPAAKKLLPYGQSKIAAKLARKAGLTVKQDRAACRHYLSRDDHATHPGHLLVYRVCFAAQVVAAKSRLEVGNLAPRGPRSTDRPEH
ncbi:hypothetical protein NLX83_07395 [Allokutzneria sp. A3M-2-11 16]|uniref:hypothetical protein n=1 Tax=Allokutzneria sp. A3M-2-11 16 TaxID=2962043 RepID=UPI0020B6F243|nr:hypothetical protein [Allokutzneria sp. A3M-2-11 16]MCP3799076.1 hypothetical protein [Allokutzneria sp. A3M-2-11 16]